MQSDLRQEYTAAQGSSLLVNKYFTAVVMNRWSWGPALTKHKTKQQKEESVLIDAQEIARAWIAQEFSIEAAKSNAATNDLQKFVGVGLRSSGGQKTNASPLALGYTQADIWVEKFQVLANNKIRTTVTSNRILIILRGLDGFCIVPQQIKAWMEETFSGVNIDVVFYFNNIGGMFSEPFDLYHLCTATNDDLSETEMYIRRRWVDLAQGRAARDPSAKTLNRNKISSLDELRKNFTGPAPRAQWKSNMGMGELNLADGTRVRGSQYAVNRPRL